MAQPRPGRRERRRLRAVIGSMRPHCAVFVATSLDGFIARADGSIDWLERANAALPPGEDCGYAAFIATVDAIVMGRNTFEQVLGFGAWPYGATPVYVLSRSLSRLPTGVPDRVTLHSAPPRELATLAWNRGHRRLYVDGGLTIQGFLREGLIDEITITVVPVLLGEGRPLFGPLPHGLSLRHLDRRGYPSGFVQSRYALDAPAGKAGPGARSRNAAGG